MAASVSSRVVVTTAACPPVTRRFSFAPAVGFCRSPGFWKRFSASPIHAAGIRQTRIVCDAIKTSSTSSDLAATEEKLKGVQLYDPSGAAVSLVDLWGNRPAVVAFGRHFGCILCRKRAEMLASRKAEMDAAGVALILIAPGSPEQARKFVETTNFVGEVYCDPDHAAYDALDFVNGVNSILNPKSGFRLIQAFTEGFRQDWGLSFYQDTVQRGGWQQGGILVAGPGANNVRYLFKDKEAGDEPELEEVISACCSK